MSVEETQQPSFTVTAGILPLQPNFNVPDTPRSPSPSSYGSVANRFEASTQLNSRPNGIVEEEQSESLQQWSVMQQKANEGMSGERENGIGPSAGNGPNEKEMTERDRGVTPAGHNDEKPSDGRMSSDGDVPDPTSEGPSVNHDAELDNVSSPTDSPPLPNPDQIGKTSIRTPNGVNSKLSPATIKHARTPLQPVNDYSPHKSRNFTMPSSSTTPLGMRRRLPQPRDDQDSFAEDRAPPPRPPVERLAQMLEGYQSGLVESSAEQAEGADQVPDWEDTAMKPEETVADHMGTLETASIVNSQMNGAEVITNGQAPSDPSQASQSVPQLSPEPPDPSLESPTRRWLKFPTSPPPRRKRFAGMLDSQSSQSMPGDMSFSQHEDLESQQSIHSVPIVATQSMPRQTAYFSSPPPSPDAHTHSHSTGTHSRHSHGTIQTTSSSIRQQTMGTMGTTQEATQIVTEDELVAAPSPPPVSSTSAPTRRALPSARAWRAGRAVISQPTDRPNAMTVVTEGPSTVAAPQAALALRQATAGPPAALKKTSMDPGQNQPDEDSGPPAQVPTPPGSSPPQTSSRAQSRARQSSMPPVSDQPMEATFVDPTITSLPPPPPHRTTPRKYGKQKAVAPMSQSSPTIDNQPLATPHPTAGPSRPSADGDVHMEDAPTSRSASPASPPRPPTKSGRVPKRKRRDSSASMSNSSSSSEEIDPLDESYRPASKTGSKLKGRARAINPSLKRVKRDSRDSRSSSLMSRRTSGSGPVIPDASTPLTTPPPSTPPTAPEYVLAYWHPNWYIGKVRGMENGRYEIDFEDQTFTDVATDRVRRGLLRKGDKVKTAGNKADEFEVVEEWQGDKRGVKIRGGRYIPLKDLYIRNSVIKSDFTDRIITPRDLGFDADIIIPPIRPASTTIRPTPTVSDIFAGKVFFITSMHTADTKYQARQKKFVDEKIVRHGGKFVDQWEDLFDLPGNGIGSTLAKTSAPFLLQETQSAALTPKMLVSLAKGIPCLSVSYIEDAISDPTVSTVEAGTREDYLS